MPSDFGKFYVVMSAKEVNTDSINYSRCKIFTLKSSAIRYIERKFVLNKKLNFGYIIQESDYEGSKYYNTDTITKQKIIPNSSPTVQNGM